MNIYSTVIDVRRNREDLVSSFADNSLPVHDKAMSTFCLSTMNPWQHSVCTLCVHGNILSVHFWVHDNTLCVHFSPWHDSVCALWFHGNILSVHYVSWQHCFCTLWAHGDILPVHHKSMATMEAKCPTLCWEINLLVWRGQSEFIMCMLWRRKSIQIVPDRWCIRDTQAGGQQSKGKGHMGFKKDYMQERKRLPQSSPLSCERERESWS